MSERTYGWSPKTLARINARRQSRGQTPYLDSRMKSDSSYWQEYQEGEEEYSNFQKKIADRNAIKKQAEVKKNEAFAEQASAMRSEAQKRDQKRQDLGRMNVEFLKMKQTGSDISWEDFKKMWASPKVFTQPIQQRTGSVIYA
jgi:hypothetical protein